MKRFLATLFTTLMFCNISYANCHHMSRAKRLELCSDPDYMSNPNTPIILIVLGLGLVAFINLMNSSKKKSRKEKKAKEQVVRPKKESFAKTTFSGGSLTGKIARLQKLYKNGTLTKAEFEKAKNKLLK